MKVDLIDVMGDDLRVVNSARVSFDKISHWENDNFPGLNGRLSEKDQKLISYLARHNHWTPFSHVQITMREKVPIFVARQRFKHMIGFSYEEAVDFSYNEVSRRYVDSAPEFFVPGAWRAKAENKKQGSSDEEVKFLELEEHVVWDDKTSPAMTVSTTEMYEALVEHAETLYGLMIKNGVAPEQARMVLPQSMYTEYFATGSLAAWARAYNLRIDAHAQKEIQDLAKMWGGVIGNIDSLKYSWRALTE